MEKLGTYSNLLLKWQKAINLVGPTMEQPEYNLFERTKVPPIQHAWV